MSNDIYTHIPTSDSTISQIRRDLPKFLTENRFLHTLNVEKQAIELSKVYFPVFNIDFSYTNDLICACLLHDITKKLTLSGQLELCNKHGFKPSKTQKDSCELLHSKTAYLEAKRLYNINDIVSDAIAYHTTGRENMNIFEKIVFISDYIEPSRKHECCIKARDMLYSGLKSGCDKTELLNSVIVYSIDRTISRLLELSKPIDENTISARNYIILNEIHKQ